MRISSLPNVRFGKKSIIFTFIAVCICIVFSFFYADSNNNALYWLLHLSAPCGLTIGVFIFFDHKNLSRINMAREILVDLHNNKNLVSKHFNDENDEVGLLINSVSLIKDDLKELITSTGDAGQYLEFAIDEMTSIIDSFKDVIKSQTI